MSQNAAVIRLLERVHDELINSGEFSRLRPDQWRHNETGIRVETGYVTGEATVILLDADGSCYMRRLHSEAQLSDFDLYAMIAEVVSTRPVVSV